MKDTLHTENLKNTVTLLQKSIDSLKQSNSLSQINYELHQKQDLINQINDFYDSAWLKLIIVISILGVVIPIIAQYFQRQNLKDLTEFIRKQMNDSFDLKISELEKFNKFEIDKTLVEFKEKFELIEKKNKALTAQIDYSLFFLQGLDSLNGSMYPDGVRDFSKCIYNLIETDIPERFEPAFANLEISLREISTKNDFDEVDYLMNLSLKMTLFEFIDYLKSHERYSTFEIYLERIIPEIERIKNIG